LIIDVQSCNEKRIDRRQERGSHSFSSTPRRVAVKGEGLEPVTVLTVFLPAQMFVSMTPVRLTISQGIKARQRETVKTVDGF
jgi:hypothetical protein